MKYGGPRGKREIVLPQIPVYSTLDVPCGVVMTEIKNSEVEASDLPGRCLC